MVSGIGFHMFHPSKLCSLFLRGAACRNDDEFKIEGEGELLPGTDQPGCSQPKPPANSYLRVRCVWIHHSSRFGSAKKVSEPVTLWFPCKSIAQNDKSSISKSVLAAECFSSVVHCLKLQFPREKRELATKEHSQNTINCYLVDQDNNWCRLGEFEKNKSLLSVVEQLLLYCQIDSVLFFLLSDKGKAVWIWWTGGSALFHWLWSWRIPILQMLAWRNMGSEICGVPKYVTKTKLTYRTAWFVWWSLQLSVWLAYFTGLTWI